MNIVNWSFITSHQFNIDHPTCITELLGEDYYPFNQLSSDIVANRKGAVFLKCPAHTDFLKNTFIFCAPFDLTIELDICDETNTIKVYCENISQEIFESIVDTRFLVNDSSNSQYPLLGIDWLTVFTSTTSTMIQVLPAFMHRNDFTEKTTIIPGEYNIHNWTRPLETLFEIRSNNEKIVIKKGDAISYIKFLSNDHVKLIQSKTPWEEIVRCNNIRNTDKFRPLKERYKSLDDVRAGKCP
jgi:hypothetical protein|tara:strand:- start:65 stop:787 length:723 start_codon:yes stop_codon:yes gene_type:complete